MYGILFFLAKKAFENGDIDRRQFLNRLENAKLVLEESMEVRKNQCCQLMNIFENYPQCEKMNDSFSSLHSVHWKLAKIW